jgi:hypothetical protein
LGLTSVENTNTTARQLQIELVTAQVTTSVCDLNNQGLASNGCGSELQSVACAAPVLLGESSNGSGSETVCEIVVDCPWLLIIAHVRS